jgi:hypothetical protein
MKEMSLIGGGIGPRYLYPNLGYKPLSENVGVGEEKWWWRGICRFKCPLKV